MTPSPSFLSRAVSFSRQRRTASHTAILFRNGRIVEWAQNDEKKTKPVCSRLGFPYATIHAEVAVVLKFLRSHTLTQLSGLKLLVLRFRFNGAALGPSRPCVNCRKYLSTLPLRGVFWIDEGGRTCVETL
jgi:hypothetical protein